MRASTGVSDERILLVGTRPCGYARCKRKAGENRLNHYAYPRSLNRLKRYSLVVAYCLEGRSACSRRLYVACRPKWVTATQVEMISRSQGICSAIPYARAQGKCVEGEYHNRKERKEAMSPEVLLDWERKSRMSIPRAPVP